MAQVVVELAANVAWRAARSAGSERWIGVCDSMGLSMEADSLDELHSVIDETMQLVLTDLLEEQELDAFLRERGWHAENVEQAQRSHDVHFQVPWELIAEGARDTSRAGH